VGRYDESLAHFRQGLDLARLTGHVDGESVHLSNIGYALIRLERYPEAAASLAESIRLSQGDARVLAEGRTGLGEALSGLGRQHEALVQLDRALAAHREHQDHRAEALTLEVMGRLHTRLGHGSEAAELLGIALTIARTLGDSRLEARVLNSMGRTPPGGPRAEAPRAQHRAALRLATSVGDRLEQARALDGLGDACLVDDPSAAISHWRAAERIYVALEVPAAARLRAKLSKHLSVAKVRGAVVA